MGLSKHAKASAANREAEDRAARRVFDNTAGSDSTDRDLGKDDMSDQIVLGGIHQPQPPAVIYPPAAQKEGLGPMASALMAMAIPASGAAGYLYQQEQPDPVPIVTQTVEDQSVKIGLGRVDDQVDE